MSTDDDIVRAFDEELGPERRSNRGFWVVAGTLALCCVLLVVEIFANRPLANSIGHAQHTLRTAQAAAEIVRARTGGFADADADGLAGELPGLSLRPGAEGSVGLDIVSVVASETRWAAAVQVRPGACFYLRLQMGSDPRYGSGTECTGEAALRANDPRW